MTFDEWWKTIYGNTPAFDESGNLQAIALLAWNTSRLFERERCAKVAESQAFAHRHAGEVGPDMLCIKAAKLIREGNP